MDLQIKELLDHIDELAGKVRGQYITVGPGQEATYIMKEAQARELVESNYTVPIKGLMRAEMIATNSTVEVSCARILTEKAQWEYISGVVETIRRPTKLAIQTATTEEDRLMAYHAGVGQLKKLLV